MTAIRLLSGLSPRTFERPTVRRDSTGSETKARAVPLCQSVARCAFLLGFSAFRRGQNLDRLAKLTEKNVSLEKWNYQFDRASVIGYGRCPRPVSGTQIDEMVNRQSAVVCVYSSQKNSAVNPTERGRSVIRRAETNHSVSTKMAALRVDM